MWSVLCCFVRYLYDGHRGLHSFPTRRSSDLKPVPDIAYLRFSSLEPGKANEIREKLQQFDKQGIHKLVKLDRKSTRLNSSHVAISYAVFCLKKKNRPRRHPSDGARYRSRIPN